MPGGTTATGGANEKSTSPNYRDMALHQETNRLISRRGNHLDEYSGTDGRMRSPNGSIVDVLAKQSISNADFFNVRDAMNRNSFVRDDGSNVSPRRPATNPMAIDDLHSSFHQTLSQVGLKNRKGAGTELLDSSKMI